MYLAFYAKHSVSETWFCIRIQVKPTELAPVATSVSGDRDFDSVVCLRTETSCISSTQLSKYHLNKEK
jgi:hypothetical protein